MKNDWPRRLTTIWLCTILTYEDASVCNFWHTCSCLGVSVRIFWHTSPWLCVVSSIISHWFTQCVSTKLYQLRDVTTCTFSLKRRSSALVWLTWTPPCATFDICGHVWAESFHCFAHCERTTRCVHCKTTCVYITFRFTKTCICVTINITLCFPPTFPSIYLNSHTTTWLFSLTNPFQYPTISIMTECIGSTGAKDC